MNNIQKAFAAKKKIGIRMADGGSVLRMSTELTPQAPSTRPVRSLRDGFNAIVDRIQERGPSLAGAAAPFAKARDDIAAHTSERGYPGQPMQAPMVATNAPAQRFADGGRADMRGGGDVRGPGGPREDKVKAWLSPGEFVVNAKAVEKFGAENLEEINEEGLPEGKSTPHERSEGNEEGIRAANGFSPKDMPMYQSQDERGGDASMARYVASMKSPAAVATELPQDISVGTFGNISGAAASATDGVRNAKGYGQTLGAVAGGGLRVLGAGVVDAGVRPVIKLIDGVRGLGADISNGFDGSDTPAAKPALPTLPVATPTAPAMRNPDPTAAPAEPTPFEARNSMRGGVSVADQRGAIPSDGLNAANAHLASFQGPSLRDPTYKLGGYDTNADIYAQATNGGKKLNSFTSTGDGSAAAEYEKSDQYQSGIRRAAADKAMLNEMVAKREAGGGQGGGVSMLGGQSVFSPIADPSKMTRGDKGREIQREQIAAQTAHQSGIRSDSIANQAANLAEQKRAHNMQGEASMRSNQIAGAKLLMDERKYGAERGDKAFEQDMRGKEFNRGVEQDSVANSAAAKTQFNAELESRNVGSDGKPDTRAIAAQRTAVEESLAERGYSHETMNKNPLMKEQLLLGAKLIDKINANASNWNPFMADFMRTVKPHQMAGLKRLPNGDAQTPDYVGPDGRTVPGQVIEKRFFTKQDSNRLGFTGVPTDEYSSLFAKETK